MFSTVDRNMLFAISVGSILGIAISLVSAFLSVVTFNEPLAPNLNESKRVKYLLTDDKDAVARVLRLFNFEINESSDITLDSNLLSKLNNLTVKLVAQAKVADKHLTLLEVTSPNESVQIMVHEGAVVNGLTIKSILKKQLVIEKDGVEYVIKLFHPKEIN